MSSISVSVSIQMSTAVTYDKEGWQMVTALGWSLLVLFSFSVRSLTWFAVRIRTVSRILLLLLTGVLFLCRCVSQTFTNVQHFSMGLNLLTQVRGLAVRLTEQKPSLSTVLRTRGSLSVFLGRCSRSRAWRTRTRRSGCRRSAPFWSVSAHPLSCAGIRHAFSHCVGACVCGDVQTIEQSAYLPSKAGETPTLIVRA